MEDRSLSMSFGKGLVFNHALHVINDDNFTINSLESDKCCSDRYDQKAINRAHRWGRLCSKPGRLFKSK